MANEVRLIDANAMREDWLENGENEYIYDTNAVLDSIDAQPTVDAVEVDVVAQMLYDAFGDECPCNYNGNDEWLPRLCGSEKCAGHDDPLYCWKQYIRHYGERNKNG